MKFCSHCGHHLIQITPPHDNRLRHVCEACGTVHYQNPTVITGCVAEWQGQILLCQRAIAPGVGSWTVPAGYMEIGETMEQAALREAREETGADIEIDCLYSVFDIKHMNQVYIIYRGRLRSPQFAPGEECQDVRLFSPADIPWDQLFYPAIGDLLQRFKDDLESGCSSLYTGSFETGRVTKFESEPPV